MKQTRTTHHTANCHQSGKHFAGGCKTNPWEIHSSSLTQSSQSLAWSSNNSNSKMVTENLMIRPICRRLPSLTFGKSGACKNFIKLPKPPQPTTHHRLTTRTTKPPTELPLLICILSWLLLVFERRRGRLNEERKRKLITRSKRRPAQLKGRF